MAEPLGGDQSVRVDDGGQDPDEAQCNQEKGGGQGDCPLHQSAVGGERRCQGDGSDESEEKGEESSGHSIITTSPILPFQFPENGEDKAEGNHSNKSNEQDAVVADEGEDEGEGDEAEENVGEEVTRRLEPFKEVGLPNISNVFRFLATDPPITATLKRNQLL